LIQSSGAGVVVPPEDHESIANAIRTLLQHPNIAAEMGVAGRNFVVTNFQWSALVRNWIAQLNRVSLLALPPKVDLQSAERDAQSPAIK
jgi:glycosyltransferase involved in cell wall biosynthesis